MEGMLLTKKKCKKQTKTKTKGMWTKINKYKTMKRNFSIEKKISNIESQKTKGSEKRIFQTLCFSLYSN